MTSPAEKRQYVRMNTVIPVEMQRTASDGTQPSSALLQAFTRDVSAGGMCLEVKSLGSKTDELFQNTNTFFLLTINPPFSSHPIRAVAKVAWVQKEDKLLPVRYRVGVAYTQIDAKSKRRIVGYAKRLLWVPRLAAVFALLLIVSLVRVSIHNQSILIENKRLVSQIVSEAQNRSQELRSLNDLSLRKTALERDLEKANKTIQELNQSLLSATTQGEAQKAAFQNELQLVEDRQKNIAAELNALKESREKLQAVVAPRQTTEPSAMAPTLDQMTGWLKSHQNEKTGLVASFEGDASVEGQSFTYDQSLACQAYLLAQDADRARRVLEFYDQKAERVNGAFYNAYGTEDGKPSENTVHTGPNLWLAIAAAQYEAQAGGGQFLPLAESIGRWAVEFQDAEGGLKGGPDFGWYSTEHNLDAYALFGMLYQLTRNETYRQAQEKVLAWTQKYAYSVKEKRMNRGKGDSTIATDAFSWAVASIGPERLKEIGFDPEEIMEFAKENCETTVEVVLSGGAKTQVTGFDFAKAQHVGRGGVISTEWTAQVIVSYRVLARYFSKIGDEERSAEYLDKAQFYLNELQKLMITSPSRVGQGRGCLPYASTENVDTGHGWRTPRGRSTGSVAGTAYALFAWMDYNPFELREGSR